MQNGLQYFALATQAYTRKLDEFLKGKGKVELAKDENQVKVVASRSAKNISAIVRDLLHTPPSYKSKIVVSWRLPTNQVKFDLRSLRSLKLTKLKKGKKKSTKAYEGPLCQLTKRVDGE